MYWHFPSEADLRSAVLDAEYTGMIRRSRTPGAGDGVGAHVLAWQAYVAWGLTHPGSYPLLFESDDALAVSRADSTARARNRFVGVATAAHPDAPLALARLLWSAIHGLVSLRLHKKDVDWQLSPAEATARIVTALSR